MSKHWFLISLKSSHYKSTWKLYCYNDFILCTSYSNFHSHIHPWISLSVLIPDTSVTRLLACAGMTSFPWGKPVLSAQSQKLLPDILSERTALLSVSAPYFTDIHPTDCVHRTKLHHLFAYTFIKCIPFWPCLLSISQISLHKTSF